MALPTGADIEVRTTGNVINGAGYTDLGGTDYSQQDAAQLSLTDLATSGTTVTTLTSATGGFTAAMVGNYIRLRSGTNLTVGFYQITAHTDTNTVTLDRAPDDGVGGVSGASGAVGGASDDPGLVCLSQANGGCWVQMVTVHVEKGTYTLTTTTAGENGPIATPSNTKGCLEGYNAARNDLQDTDPTTSNAPVIDASAQNGMDMVSLGAGSGDLNPQKVIGIVLDGQDGATNDGFKGVSPGFTISIRCRVIDCRYAYDGIQPINCRADSCVVGFVGGSYGTSCNPWKCAAYDCTTAGFVIDRGSAFHCYAEGSTSRGFYVGDRTLLMNCLSVNSGGDGIEVYDYQNQLIDCMVVDSGGHGLAFSSAAIADAAMVVNFAHYNSTSGGVEFTPGVNINEIALSADPLTDQATDDFEPNDTAGGGALIRGAGVPTPGQTANHDVGPIQHDDPAGGGGSSSIIGGGNFNGGFA